MHRDGSSRPTIVGRELSQVEADLMAVRFGVDVGGTFTDLVVLDDETGSVYIAKGLSTPASPEDGVANLLESTLTPELISTATLFTHGSTVALNAILQRAGAVVGLLTTAGFRDVLELRRGERDRMFDISWKPPPPLIPRRLRLPVTERIRADGSIETPFDEASVLKALEAFTELGVFCVAVSFLNSYVNPIHELQAEEALRRAGFLGEISLSHKVSGEYREFERTSTVAIDAYVKPVVGAYLGRLAGRLQGLGFASTAIVTTSGGGAMTFTEAAARPFQTINSGPVAGAVSAGVLCQKLGIESAITADVGGTSFDTCLIDGGRPQLRYEGRVGDMPIQAPWIDVRSIGAGGGSIAHVDEEGRLHVGPRSAGADPGPVCYARGGGEVTVTDAAAVLGMLAFGNLAGGVTLELAGARSAVTDLGEKLGLGMDEMARGVLNIATAKMADAIREVSLEQGHDPRAAALIVFGGAGPLFGTLLARELEMSTVLVPRHAGNFSAWGLLEQDLVQSSARTFVGPVDPTGMQAASDLLAALFDELERRTALEGGVVREAALDLRYVGQEYTITIPVPLADGRIATDPALVESQFVESYQRSFGHALQDAVELVCVRAVLRAVLPRPSGRFDAEPRAVADSDDSELVAYSFRAGSRVPFTVVHRSGLVGGSSLVGPAIVLEGTSSTYVDVDDALEIDDVGTLKIALVSD